MEEQGSNKSLNVMLGVVVFGIFLTITYWFFVDSFRAKVSDSLVTANEHIKIVLDAGIGFVKGEEPNNSDEDGGSGSGIDHPSKVGCATNIYPEFIVRNNDENKTTVIIDYTGDSRDVIIPSDIECYTVVGIDPYAFNTVSDELATNIIDVELQSVELPNTLTFIGKYAFRSNSLKEVEFDGSLETIGAGAFMNNMIKEIVFSTQSKLDSIGIFAFFNNKITDLRVPEGIKTLGSGTFANNLINGLALPKTLLTITGSETDTGAFEDNHIKEFVIPADLTVIGANAFNKNHLKEVDIPNSVTTIEYGAFKDNHLQVVSLSDNLEKLGNYAFKNNIIDTIKIPETLTTLGSGVFATNKLTSIDFPSTFLHINGTVGEEGAFEDNLLNNVSLPKSLLTLGESAFKKNKLTKATVPITTLLASTAFDNNVKVTRK
jgi:hypothetical protein